LQHDLIECGPIDPAPLVQPDADDAAVLALTFDQHRERNRVERFFNELKTFRRIGTCYDKLGANFFAFFRLASIRIYLRSIESTLQQLYGSDMIRL
jgi:hypothetical protein